MIARLDKHELVLTYSWNNSNHGITGHIFEVIDYFWILKDHFDCCMFFAEVFNIQDLERMVKAKYDFTDDEVQLILDRCVFQHKPKIVIAKNILFTDGGMHRDKDIVVKADNKFMFSCSVFESEGYIVLEDRRVYGRDNIDYKKKILFDRLRVPERSDKKSLLYLTNNCRSIGLETYEDLATRDEEFLCLVNDMCNVYGHPKFKYEIVPMDNLYERFNKYVYTPVRRKWDCSPRFIAECKWMGKEVEFYNIDYWDEDLGLKYRVWDIENDFESIHLREDDDIVGILKDYI